MIDETMLPREGLFDRTFSVLAEIRHLNNSARLADINSITPALSKRLTERREAVPAWDCVASYIYDTNGKLKNDLVVRHSKHSESNLDCMGMDKLYHASADRTFCIHLDKHVSVVKVLNILTD